MASANLEFQVFEEHKRFPLFKPDVGDTMPASVLRLREPVAKANAIRIVSPEYDHGVLGTRKNALDWLLSDK